jgi:hypothetical protein
MAHLRRQAAKTSTWVTRFSGIFCQFKFRLFF